MLPAAAARKAASYSCGAAALGSHPVVTRIGVSDGVKVISSRSKRRRDAAPGAAATHARTSFVVGICDIARSSHHLCSPHGQWMQQAAPSRQGPSKAFQYAHMKSRLFLGTSVHPGAPRQRAFHTSAHRKQRGGGGDFYKTLEVGKSASQQDIKAQFYKVC